MTLFLAFLIIAANTSSGETQALLDHEVVLDESGRLQPWTSYQRIIDGSMAYIKQCPTVRTRHGKDPWYLVTSKLKPDGSFRRNQNNQGSNAYYAVETLKRYLDLTRDQEAVLPVELLLKRVLHYHTPADWAWPHVPRTQDDSPDGCYTDEWSDVDKMCMAGLAYLRFAEITSNEAYIAPAINIATTVMAHLGEGDETHSPLPFRVNMRTGEVLDPYTAGMVFPARFFDELAERDLPKRGDYAKAHTILWEWVLRYPVQNQRWSGYYEDVKTDHANLNQQIPLETARYMLEHFEGRGTYAIYVPAIIEWVQNRFGQTKRFGATSIREQDGCFFEMSSHTARYASIVAGWWALCEEKKLLDQQQRDALREEARASLALCSYSTWSKHSKGECALNYVGLGYLDPWFSDSYFDFLPHVMDSMHALGLATQP